MVELTSRQRKHLRGLAHGLEPAVLVGRAGLTPAVIGSIEQALEANELIKVKLVRFKEQRREIAQEIGRRSSCHLVGLVGNVGIFYREQPDPKRRIIELPAREG